MGVNEMSVLIQRLIRLSYNKIIFFIRGKVYNIVRNDRILRIRLIQYTIWSLNKSILVDPCIGRQRVDQTDVRTFRGLDRTHSSIMGVVYVTHLESCTVSGQSSRTQCRQTTLMCQLRQRIVVIHELRKLGASEELLHCRGHRFNIDQRLRCDGLDILGRHSLSDNSFQPGKTDSVLVLQQFSHRSDTAVA